MGLEFDGTNKYVIVNNSPSLTITTAITIRLVAKWSDVNYKYFFCKGNNVWGVLFYPPAYGTKIDCVIRTTAGTQDLTAVSDYNDGNFHDIVITFDSSLGSDNMKLYIDGIFNAQRNTTGTIDDSLDSPIYFGQYAPGDGAYSGEIYDFRVYNRALTSSEILTIYNSKGSDKIVEGLVGRWLMMEQPEGNVPVGLPTTIFPLNALNSDANITDAGGEIIGTLSYAGGVDGATRYNTPKFTGAITAAQINSVMQVEFNWTPHFSSVDAANEAALLNITNGNLAYIIDYAWFGAGGSIGQITFHIINYNTTAGAIYSFETGAFSAESKMAIKLISDPSLGAGEKLKMFLNDTPLTINNVFGYGGDVPWVFDADCSIYIVDPSFNANPSYAVIGDLKITGTGSAIVYDSSGNGNNGTPVNSPVYKASHLRLHSPRRNS